MDNQTDNIKSLGGNLWKTAEADERAAELIAVYCGANTDVARRER